MVTLAFALAFLLVMAAPAIGQAPLQPLPGAPGFSPTSPGRSGIQTLPGGFQLFKDSSGNTGILQRTPDSGFPASQFRTPVPPALPPLTPVRPDLSPPSSFTPSAPPTAVVPVVPGQQIVPVIPGQVR